jgi:hypothetical protein
MPALFTAVYLVQNEQRHTVAPTSTAADFYSARAAGVFPFDAADDPSFFSSSSQNGPVTWGVCRLDVRTQLQPGDWVVFFARKPIGAISQYRFSAAVRVAAKHRHWALPARFKNYLNLLVAPTANGFVHLEPALHQNDWHKDWLWRMSAGRRGRKEALERAGCVDHLRHLFEDAGDAPAVGSYIEFDEHVGFRHPRPPVVANWEKPNKCEVWLPKAIALRTLIFGPTSTRWLRTSNPQQPHRHTKRPLEDGEWIRKVEIAMPS